MAKPPLGGKSPWRVLDTATTRGGATVEMYYAEFGKGRTKVVKWEFYRDDEKAGYAAIERDARENWERVKADYVRNSSNGRYEKAVTDEPA